MIFSAHVHSFFYFRGEGGVFLKSIYLNLAWYVKSVSVKQEVIAL